METRKETITNESKDHVQDDQKQQKQEEEDEEGLRVDGYDVILCGTGLVQSILAAALARAGKRILHCDGNDVYGELHAVLSLQDYQHHLKHLSLTHHHNILLHSHGPTPTLPSLTIGTFVSTPYGSGKLSSLPNNNNNNNNVSVKLSFGTVYFGMTNHHYYSDDWSQILEEKEHVVSHTVQQIRSLLSSSARRSYALDLTPGLLYGSGPAVQGLIDSSVSEYCEFKNILGLYLLDSSSQPPQLEQKKKKKKPTSTSRQSSSSSRLARVPCSKGDVFKTKLLSPTDKRRLMKVLHLTSDYAVAQVMKQQQHPPTPTNDNTEQQQDTNNNDDTSSTVVVEDERVISSVNERHLKQGRSLSRPQNKEVSTTALDLLQSYIDKNEVTLDEYLAKEHGLSDHLRHLVLYALALSSSPNVSIKDGMDQLCLHLQSLGRYGKTALLAPIYGAGELTQAFCRSAAVHGATYLLRRDPTNILLTTPSIHPDNNHHNHHQPHSPIIKGITLSPPSFHNNDHNNTNNEEGKTILAPHVVISKLSNIASKFIETNNNNNDDGGIHFKVKRRILRRISILNGTLICDNSDSNNNNEQRHVIIIPPSSSSSSSSSIQNSYVIQCVVLDESVNIAPAGATVLHLTTTVDTNNNNETQIDDSILKRAVKELIQSNEKQSKSTTSSSNSDYDDDDETTLQEIFHISYSYPCTRDHDDDASTHDTNVQTSSSLQDNTNSSLLPHGLHLCDSPSPLITELDSAFAQAKELFETIVDDKSLDFLLLSNQMEEVIRENHAGRLAHDEDEESRLLQSAISMLNTTTDK